MPASRFFSSALPLVVLTAAMALFAGAWTVFGWQLYLSLRLPVFDFGINYQTIWAAAHGTNIDFWGVGVGSLILYIFVPVYWLVPSTPDFFLFLIAFQAAWLALGALPLYLVAKERLRHSGAALALAVGYLLFPALQGAVFFPVHFEALFPTFLLFGYWTYRRGWFWATTGFWVASLFTQIGATFFISALALGILLEPRLPQWVARIRRARRGTRTSEPEGRAPVVQSRWTLTRDRLGIVLLVSSAVVFVVVGTVYGWFWYLHYVTKTGPSGSSFSQPLLSPPSLVNLPIQLWTLLLLLGGLLFLPLWGREERWALIPYVGGILVLARPGFWYPFRDQYPSIVAAILFMATVRGIERLAASGRRPDPTPSDSAEAPSIDRRRLPRRSTRTVSLSAAVLLSVVATGVFIAPWGPLNNQLPNNALTGSGRFQIGQPFATNLTLDSQLRLLAAGVPDRGVLLLQNNLVEPLGREYFTVPSRLTPDIRVDYALTDPYDPSFYLSSFLGPLPTPMIGWANHYLSQGWGIRGEADGALLLQANYTGAPTVYFPVNQWFFRSNFPCCGTSPVWNSSSAGNWLMGPTLPFAGGFKVFAPGTYRVVLNLIVDHPSPTDRLQFTVSANRSALTLLSANISGASWNSTSGPVQLIFSLKVSSYLLLPRFQLHVAHWTGPLELASLNLLQVAP